MGRLECCAMQLCMAPSNLQNTVWIWQICNYRFVGAVVFYGLCFMHALETYRLFGAPYCFTVLPLIFEPFSTPSYILNCFFALILTIGSHNHTNTHISQLKTCVIEYYILDSYTQSSLQLPKHRPPDLCDYKDLQTQGLLSREKNHQPSESVEWISFSTPTRHNVLRFFQEKISSRPTLSRGQQKHLNLKNQKVTWKKPVLYKIYENIYIQNHRKLAIKSLLRTS